MSVVFSNVIAVWPSANANLKGPSSRVEAAWRELRAEMHRFIRARVSSPAIADDILQDVFLRVQRKRAELNRIANLRAWVFQVTRNAVIDHQRGQRRQQPQELVDLPEDSVDSAREVRERLAPCLRAMVDELPPIYGNALRLVELEDLSGSEAARQLHVSLSALKARVRRGRALLKKRLLDCCHFEVTADGQVQDYWRKSTKYQPKQC